MKYGFYFQFSDNKICKDSASEQNLLQQEDPISHLCCGSQKYSFLQPAEITSSFSEGTTNFACRAYPSENALSERCGPNNSLFLISNIGQMLRNPSGNTKA